MSSSELPKAIQAIYETLEQSLEGSLNLTRTEDSQTTERELIEFNGLMRVFGLEKFNAPCLAFTTSLFASTADRDKKSNALGAVVFYLVEEGVEFMLKAIKARGVDEEDEKSVDEAISKYVQELVQDMAKRLQSQGYRQLFLGETEAYRNEIPQGVPFPKKQRKYYELAFHFWKMKAVAVDAVMKPA